MEKRSSRTVYVGRVPIGGIHPVTVQSMLSRPSADIPANVEQAKALAAAGCELVRVAIPDKKAVALLPALKQAVDIPVIADIHFDHRLALDSAAAGADKIRINPGNIGGEERIKEVAKACATRRIPIRIGVNSGSLSPELLAKYGGPTAEALRDSALYHVSLLEKFDFTDIILSLKSSHVATMVRACEMTAACCAYPLHVGVTEAGTERMGLLKSAAGIGGLLLHGIGDTIRLSLTADPVAEVTAAIDLLRALELRPGGPNIISCPTCGRTAIDLISITEQVEARVRHLHTPLTVAVMGCAVNGPGEAKEADIGIAGGDGRAVIFRKGKVIRTVKESQVVEELLREIEQMTQPLL